MNKGSFYFKFYDKLDLYLCMLERAGKDKTEFLSQRLSADSASTDFFQQLRGIAQGTLEYARHDPRFYSYWRIYLSESDELKKMVHDAFPELAVDFLGELIDIAIGSNQIDSKYDRSFVEFTVQTYLNNLDKLVDANMSDEEIIGKVEQVVSFLKGSLSSR